jgi:hypothetical protein
MLRAFLSYAILAAALLRAVYGAGDDITIPLEGGSVVVQNIRMTTAPYAGTPWLAFTLRNRTSLPWQRVVLQFEVDGHCKGEPKHWSATASTFLGSVEDDVVARNADVSEEAKEKIALALRDISNQRLLPSDRVEGCVTDKVQTTLVSAENSKVRVNGVTGERIDLERQRADAAAAQAERERIAAEEQAERTRVAAEEQAKEDVAEAARQKRLAAEAKKKQADEDARAAKIRADRDAKEAEERQKIRATCTIVYQNTIDTKLKDLTVRQEQQVRACQALGLYPPN